MRSSWAFGVAAPLAYLVACSGELAINAPDGGGHGTTIDSGGSGSSSGADDSGGAGSSGSSGGGGASSSGGIAPGASACMAGNYTGTLEGTYTSHLAVIGVALPVAGNVSFELATAGGPNQTCRLDGEVEPCNELSTLEGRINGDFAGLFPYSCTMTGALDCWNGKLDNGWMDCIYCLGPLAGSGTMCAVVNADAGAADAGTDSGGHFVGPLTATFDIQAQSFVMGTWNGVEVGPNVGIDGGPTGYLPDGGIYAANAFGGDGTWEAKLVIPPP